MLYAAHYSYIPCAAKRVLHTAYHAAKYAKLLHI